jgi:hypothetical protein
MARRYSRSASKKVAKAMHERKKGSLRSGSGKKVTSRKQAIAIGLSEARRAGKKVPKKSSRKSPATKSPAKTSAKKAAKKTAKKTARKATTRATRTSSPRKRKTGRKGSKR